MAWGLYYNVLIFQTLTTHQLSERNTEKYKCPPLHSPYTRFWWFLLLVYGSKKNVLLEKNLWQSLKMFFAHHFYNNGYVHKYTHTNITVTIYIGDSDILLETYFRFVNADNHMDKSIWTPENTTSTQHVKFWVSRLCFQVVFCYLFIHILYFRFSNV